MSEQLGLPEDPMEHTRGSQYLRLTGDCPEKGVFINLGKPEVVHNDKFGKDEYQWPVTHYTPSPVVKILTESSPGFCTALKASTEGKPYGKVLKVRWNKIEVRGRPMKEWSITLATEADIKAAFA